MNILDIKSPADIKKLNIDQLNDLCKDIRTFLIDSVSKTGGHLASNLGVVELTVALQYSLMLDISPIFTKYLPEELIRCQH